MTRSLLVTPNLPYPTRSGPDLRAWQVANALSALGPTAVFGVISRPHDAPQAPGIEVWQTAADAALDQRWESGSALQPGKGGPADAYHSPGAEGGLLATLEAFRPDLVVLDHIWLGRYLQTLRPYPATLILNTHNVEADLQRWLAEAETSRPTRMVRTLFARQVEDLERSVVETADAVWACSETDAARLRERYDPAAVSVVPNTVDTDSYAAVPASLAPGVPEPGQHAVIFPAQFSYPPNQVAAETLIRHIFPPLVTRYPDARLLLVGRSPTPAMRNAAEGDPRIVVTGGVDDVRPYLAAASIMAVPLEVGSGTRFKVLEAFAAGLPVVSTAVGIEGLAVAGGTHLLLAERPDEFVEQVSRVWEDAEVASTLRERASGLVEQCYSWRASEGAIRASLRTLGRDGITE